MGMKFEITQEQLSGLHNSRVWLLYAIESLEEVINADYLKKLRKAHDELYRSYKPIMQQYDDLMDEKRKRNERLGEGLDLISVWSMYEIELVDKFNLPASVLSYNNNDLPIPENAAWMDIWILADNLIKQSGDLHHIFIEGVYVKDGKAYLNLGS